MNVEPVDGSFIQGLPNLATDGKPDSATIIQKLAAGLPVRELNDLQSGLDLPMEKVASLLGISKATPHRRKAAGRLDTSESDRVVRFARSLGQAVAVLESEGHVPSVIIRGEANFLLNPSHPDFKKMAIGAPKPFAFDPRLL